jgi:hypothetical protein
VELKADKEGKEKERIVRKHGWYVPTLHNKYLFEEGED